MGNTSISMGWRNHSTTCSTSKFDPLNYRVWVVGSNIVWRVKTGQIFYVVIRPSDGTYNHLTFFKNLRIWNKDGKGLRPKTIATVLLEYDIHKNLSTCHYLTLPTEKKSTLWKIPSPIYIDKFLISLSTIVVILTLTIERIQHFENLHIVFIEFIHCSFNDCGEDLHYICRNTKKWWDMFRSVYSPSDIWMLEEFWPFNERPWQRAGNNVGFFLYFRLNINVKLVKNHFRGCLYDPT